MTASSSGRVDPITREIVRGAIQACGCEMDTVIERTAMSPFIREKKDYFAGIADAQARIVFTMHERAGPGMLEAVFEYYPAETMRPGDVFWMNDCYLTKGAISHTSDMAFIMPVFLDREIVAYALAFGHFWDIGGARPGSLSPYNTDVFQEGLSLPPVRIVQEGRIDDALYRTILRNSRFPDMLEGDSRAMMAACTLGQSRMLELFQRFGTATVNRAIDELHDQSEQVVRRYLSESFRPGRYSFVEYVDSDCVSDNPIRIQVDAELGGGEVRLVDATASDDQVRGPMNAILHPEIARMILSRFLIWKDDAVMHNRGACRPIGEIRLRPGSIFQPHRPAALGLRAHVIMRMVQAVLGIGAQATDGETPASSPDNVIVMLRALDTATGAYFLCTDGIGAGHGARPMADGIDTAYALRGQKNYPIEFMEEEFPLRIERYGAHEDSGGPGRYRGGIGLVREFRMLAGDVTLAVRMNGMKCPVWGVKGGRHGRPGSIVVNPGTDRERILPGFCDDVTLNRGDLLRVTTSGGGGYGDPLDREAERVQEDVLDGFVSLAAARADYGVVLDPATLAIDHEATRQERDRRRAPLPLFDRGPGFEALERSRQRA